MQGLKIEFQLVGQVTHCAAWTGDTLLQAFEQVVDLLGEWLNLARNLGCQGLYLSLLQLSDSLLDGTDSAETAFKQVALQ